LQGHIGIPGFPGFSGPIGEKVMLVSIVFEEMSINHI